MQIKKLTNMYTELQKEARNLEEEIVEIEGDVDYHANETCRFDVDSIDFNNNEYEYYRLQDILDELQENLDNIYNQMENIQDMLDNVEDY